MAQVVQTNEFRGHNNKPTNVASKNIIIEPMMHVSIGTINSLQQMLMDISQEITEYEKSELSTLPCAMHCKLDFCNSFRDAKAQLYYINAFN